MGIISQSPGALSAALRQQRSSLAGFPVVVPQTLLSNPSTSVRYFSSSPNAENKKEAVSSTSAESLEPVTKEEGPSRFKKMFAGRENGYWVIEIENEYGENFERVFKLLLALTVLSPVLYFLYVERQKVEITKKRLLSRLANSHSKFFSRDDEMKELATILNADPDKILIVTGPSDSGKTALISNVVRDRKAFLFFNLRQNSAASVNDFVRYFNDITDAKYLTFRSWIVDMLPWSGGEGNFELRDSLSHADLQKSLSSLREALEDIRSDPNINEAPILVFDEFGSLLNLTREADGVTVLDTLLQFLADVSKSKLAHCILNITDAEVMKDLNLFNSRNVSSRSRFFCLGDFTRDESKRFLTQFAIDNNMKMSEETKDRVIDVVGGRILDLQTIGKLFVSLLSLFLSLSLSLSLSLWLSHSLTLSLSPSLSLFPLPFLYANHFLSHTHPLYLSLSLSLSPFPLPPPPSQPTISAPETPLRPPLTVYWVSIVNVYCSLSIWMGLVPFHQLW